MASYPRALARDSSSGDHTLQEGTERIADRYVVRERIGTGGMGIVVAAWDEKEQREVALKLLQASREDEYSVQRFFREARMTDKIKSHFVVRVLDVGLDGDRPYIAMERLSGEDLAARLKRAGPIPAQEAVDFAIQACDALAYAHGAGIVHRDIKPSNLFQQQNPDGSTYIKILDFGISKSLTREEWETTLTVTGESGLLGSPAYMSPEQIRSAKRVDHRSDFWSLGIVLYKLISGRQPFDGDSVGEIFVRILERTYPSLTQLHLQVPQGVELVIAKCLQQSRSKRFRSAGEIAMALAPFASPRGQQLAAHVAQYSLEFPPAFVMDDEEASMPSLPGAEYGSPSGSSPWLGAADRTIDTGQSGIVASLSPGDGAVRQKYLAIGLGAFALMVLGVLAAVLLQREDEVPHGQAQAPTATASVTLPASAPTTTTTTPQPSVSVSAPPSATVAKPKVTGKPKPPTTASTSVLHNNPYD